MRINSARILFAALAALALTLAPCASAQYTETTLYNFGTFSTDAESPSWGLVRDAAGNLYGASNSSLGGLGAAYELSPSIGGGWTESILHQFVNDGTDAHIPSGPLTMDASGNLFGITQGGGVNNKGAVYELSPNSSGGWTEAVIYSFAGGTDGQWGTGNLTFDAAGNLYGTTFQGGSGTNANCLNVGCGTVFELSPSSSGWTEKVIYNFTGGGDGMSGGGNLLFDSAGRLYGAAVAGGVQIGSGCFDGCGTVYRLTPVSGSWRFARLFDFQGEVGGAAPGAIVFDAEGNIYGIGFTGGSFCLPLGCGVVFELTPPASGGPWKEKVLHIFSELHDGGGPGGGIAFDSSGNLFGTADFGGNGNLGTVWKLSPGAKGFWTLTQLYSFGNGSTGSRPNSGVILDSLGNLYGTAQQGGEFGRGSIFELSPSSADKR